MPRGARFGEISKLPSGKYRARYRGPDGVRYSGPHTFVEQKHARFFLNGIEHAITLGTWEQPTRATAPAPVTNFADYAEMRIQARHHRVKQPLKLSTVELYRKLLRLELEPAFGHLDLTQITPAQVEEWHSESLRRRNPTQTGNAYMFLKSLFTDAMKAGLTPLSPCQVEGAGKPKPARDGEALTHAELLTYLAAVPEHRRMPLMIMAATGLRVGEALALRRMDVDLKERSVKVARTVGRVARQTHFDTPKTAAGVRKVFLPESVAESMREWIESQPLRGREALLFPSSDPSRPLSENVLRDAHRKGVAAIGKEFTMHDLRRTAATLAGQQGATVKELMRLLGHTTPNMAMLYQRADDDRMRTIAGGWEEAHIRAAEG